MEKDSDPKFAVDVLALAIELVDRHGVACADQVVRWHCGCMVERMLKMHSALAGGELDLAELEGSTIDG